MKIGKIKNTVNFAYISNFIYIKRKKIIIGKTSRIIGKVYFNINKNSVAIGEKCIIRSGIETNTLGGMDECRFVTHGNGRIELADNVGISNTCIVSHTLVKIESDVNIGGDCKIYDSDFHSILFKDRHVYPDKEFVSKPIIIKKGAFIGAHSIILKGVTIGQRSVIGAGSVVTRNIPDDEIWAGNPAKFIKKIDN